MLDTLNPTGVTVIMMIERYPTGMNGPERYDMIWEEFVSIRRFVEHRCSWFAVKEDRGPAV